MRRPQNAAIVPGKRALRQTAHVRLLPPGRVGSVLATAPPDGRANSAGQGWQRPARVAGRDRRLRPEGHLSWCQQVAVLWKLRYTAGLGHEYIAVASAARTVLGGQVCAASAPCGW